MSNIINIEEKKKQKAVFNTRDAVESSIDLSKKDKTLTLVAIIKQQKKRILTWSSYQKEPCQNRQDA